jgi:hypothetical protein
LVLFRVVANSFEERGGKHDLVSHIADEIPNNAGAIGAGRHTFEIILPQLDASDDTCGCVIQY